MSVELTRGPVRSAVRDEYEWESADAANSVTVPMANRPECLLSVSCWDEDSVGGSIGDGTLDLEIDVHATADDPGATLASYETVSAQAIRVLGSWDHVTIRWTSATKRVHVFAAACGSVPRW